MQSLCSSREDDLCDVKHFGMESYSSWRESWARRAFIFLSSWFVLNPLIQVAFRIMECPMAKELSMEDRDEIQGKKFDQESIQFSGKWITQDNLVKILSLGVHLSW